jgi:hypothetical protein
VRSKADNVTGRSAARRFIYLCQLPATSLNKRIPCPVRRTNLFRRENGYQNAGLRMTSRADAGSKEQWEVRAEERADSLPV